MGCYTQSSSSLIFSSCNIILFRRTKLKQSVSILIILSILSLFSTFFATSTLGQSDPFAPGYQSFELPPQAVQGKSSESQAAVAGLSPSEKQYYEAMLKDVIQDVRNNPPPPPRGSKYESIAVSNEFGYRQFQEVSKSTAAQTEFTFVAPPPSTTVSACGQSIEQFVKATYVDALGRQPLATELFPAEDALALAQSQGSSQLVAAGQNLAATLFQSVEYSNLGRTDRQFVYDLFEVYKMLQSRVSLLQATGKLRCSIMVGHRS